MTTDVKAAIEAMNSEVKDFINKTNEEIETHGKLGRENKEAMAKLEEKSAEVMDRLLDLEQKQSAQAEETKAVKSSGAQFIKSEAFAAMQSGASKHARFEVQNNTITGSDTTVAPDRQSGIVPGASRILRISDVLSSGVTASNAVEYTKENVFTNAAAETAENTAKPESSVTFTLESAPVATIAHWIKLSKQVIDDAPMLASYVDGRMRYGVLNRFDSQLLNGNGTGANIGGLANTGNHTAFSPAGGSKGIDNIRKAITAILQADYAASAVILNPADVEALDLEKGTDGHFVASDARTAPGQTIWGLPIVQSNAMTAGKFMVGDFSMGAQYWNRQGVTVDLSESDDTNFQSNLVTLRAEMRAALTVFRAACFQYGDLQGA